MSRRPPEVQKVFNHINRANRLLVNAVERYAEVDSKIGVLPGHRVEMRRRLLALKIEADQLVRQLEERR